MRKEIKEAMIFIAGTALGSYVTWKKLKSSFEARLAEQDKKSWEYWKDYFEKKKDISVEEEDDELEKEASAIVSNIVDTLLPKETKNSDLYPQSVDTTVTNYAACFDGKVHIEDEKKEKELCREPYAITRQIFEDPSDGYDQIRMHYFNEDDTYTDEEDCELMHDELRWPDMLGRCPMEWDDPDIYYVKNEKERTKLEVTVYNTAYSKYMGDE